MVGVMADMVVLQAVDGVQIQLHLQADGILQEHQLLARRLGGDQLHQLPGGLRILIKVVGEIKEELRHPKILRQLQLDGMLQVLLSGVRMHLLLLTHNVFDKIA